MAKIRKKITHGGGSDHRYDHHKNKNIRSILDDVTVQPFLNTYRKKKNANGFTQDLISWLMRRRRTLYWNSTWWQWLCRRRGMMTGKNYKANYDCEAANKRVPESGRLGEKNENAHFALVRQAVPVRQRREVSAMVVRRPTGARVQSRITDTTTGRQ
ncbi:hypothetical protein ACI65C_008184 [Semiaphis heraclei]